MKYLDMIKGDPVMPEIQREFTVGFDQLRAKTCGVFQGIADQGDMISKGQLIGKVTGLDGSPGVVEVKPGAANMRGVRSRMLLATMKPQRPEFIVASPTTLAKVAAASAPSSTRITTATEAPCA